MINFLRKLFIKNYQDVNNEKVRTAHGVLAACGGIFINLLLFSLKLLIGIITVSMSIISDAINNLTDLFSCFVNLIGFKMASKPADFKHPFGHERIEYIAGMIISFIIIGVALVLGYSAITTLISGNSDTNYNVWAFVILGASILFKVILGLFYYGLGKAINSVALKASMQDSFNDCISTGCVLIASLTQFLLLKYANINAWYIDPSISILVAIFILYSGIKMIVETASPLIGSAPDEKLFDDIVKDVESYKGVLGTHDAIMHSYGPTKIFMTIHVEVDGYENMFKSHDMIDNIEKEVGNKYGISLTVHMDPVDTKNKEIPILKEQISELLPKIHSDLSFHDLRVVAGPTHTNVIFDLVVPNDKDIDKAKLAHQIRKEIKKIKPQYFAVINFDEKYVK